MEAGGVVAGTDVALAREGRYGDGVLELRLWQVVADAAVDVALSEHRHTLDIFNGSDDPITILGMYVVTVVHVDTKGGHVRLVTSLKNKLQYWP